MHLGAVILLCYKAQNAGIAKATARLWNAIAEQKNKYKQISYSLSVTKVGSPYRVKNIAFLLQPTKLKGFNK